MPGRGIFDALLVRGRAVFKMHDAVETATAGVPDGTLRLYQDAVTQAQYLQTFSLERNEWEAFHPRAVLDTAYAAIDHSAAHAENGGDELLVEDLGATSVNTSTALRPDGTGGAAFSDVAFGDLTGTISDTQHGTVAQSNAHAHSNLSGVTTDQHHAQSHGHTGGDGSGSVAHSATTSQTVDDHHNEAHAVGSTGPHAQSGLTAGHVLRASGASAFDFAAVQAGDLPDHASRHERGGLDEIDGDHLGIDFTPTNYAPSTTPAEAADLDDLAAHLAGIDDALVAGWEVISEGALATTGSMIDVSSISTDYDHFRLTIWVDQSYTSGADIQFLLRFNNDSATSYQLYHQNFQENMAEANTVATGQTSVHMGGSAYSADGAMALFCQAEWAKGSADSYAVGNFKSRGAGDGINITMRDGWFIWLDTSTKINRVTVANSVAAGGGGTYILEGFKVT